MPSPLRVHFIHGLESSPHGEKARYLAARFDARTPHMDTSDLEGAIETQRASIAARRPDVLVGSSFGGAVAVALLARGHWRGPTLLLAQAAAKLGIHDPLPDGVPITLVHGAHDAIVPIEDSRALAKTGTPGLVVLEELDDEHRLSSLVSPDAGRRDGSAASTNASLGAFRSAPRTAAVPSLAELVTELHARSRA